MTRKKRCDWRNLNPAAITGLVIFADQLFNEGKLTKDLVAIVKAAMSEANEKKGQK